LISVEKATPAERLHERPTSIVRRKERAPLAICALDGPGSAHELGQQLAEALPGRDAA
jgi:hypothetical protein